MRNSREKWTFFQHPNDETNNPGENQQVISSSEVNYWKRQLRGILKVGLEFEFNLPNKNGNCKGDSTSCPCATMGGNNCWTECSSKETCLGEKGYEKCEARSKECDAGSCDECDDYKITCKIRLPEGSL